MTWMNVLQIVVLLVFAGIVAEVVIDNAIEEFGKLYDKEDS